MPRELSQHPRAISSREYKKNHRETYLAQKRKDNAKCNSTKKGRIKLARNKGNYSELMGAISLEEWATLLWKGNRRKVRASRNKDKVWHKDNIPSDLDYDWILQLLKAGCPRLGYYWREDIVIPEHLRPSLDRIDSDGGYTKDNVQITCRIYNIAKNAWSDYDVIEAARMIVRKADERHGLVTTKVDFGHAPMQRHHGRWVHA